MKTTKAFAELRDGSRIGIVNVIKSYWSGKDKAHIIEVEWSDKKRVKYISQSFKSFTYLMG